MAIELRALPRFTFPSKTGGPQTQALTVGILHSRGVQWPR